MRMQTIAIMLLQKVKHDHAERERVTIYETQVDSDGQRSDVKSVERMAWR